MTPGRSRRPCTVTSIDGSMRRSTPPIIQMRRKPSSSIFDTIMPISSRCAANMIAAGGSLAAPFFHMTALPSGSRLISSTRSAKRPLTTSQAGDSYPVTPRASARCISACLVSMTCPLSRLTIATRGPKPVEAGRSRSVYPAVYSPAHHRLPSSASGNIR